MRRIVISKTCRECEYRSRVSDCPHNVCPYERMMDYNGNCYAKRQQLSKLQKAKSKFCSERG